MFDICSFALLKEPIPKLWERLESFCKNLIINPKIPKTCADHILVIWFLVCPALKQWEFFNGLIFNFCALQFSIQITACLNLEDI